MKGIRIDHLRNMQDYLIDSCQNYYDAVSKEIGKKGFIWVKNDETGQLVVYTRGEFTNEIMSFLEQLDKMPPVLFQE